MQIPDNIAEVRGLLRKKDKNAWNPLTVFKCVLIPTVLFVYVAYLVGHSFRHHYPRWAIFLGPVLGLLFCLSTTSTAIKRVRLEVPARESITLCTALWCALVMAAVGGDAIFRWDMSSYYTYEDLASYINVDPNQDKGQTYMDAGQVYFKESSYVMTTKAVAFESAGVYCVAPIVRWPPQDSAGVEQGRLRRAGCSTECSPPACGAGSPTDGGSLLETQTTGAGLEVCTRYCSARNDTAGTRFCGSGGAYESGDFVDCSTCQQASSSPSQAQYDGTRVELPASGTIDFWAVGKDCCDASGANFKCGAVDNPRARAGLRMLRDDIRPFFLMAVQEWSAWVGEPAKHPLFFYWVEDPVAEVEGHNLGGSKKYTEFVALFVAFIFFFTLTVLYGLQQAGFP